jgi:predicted transcriptional regulator
MPEHAPTTDDEERAAKERAIDEAIRSLDEGRGVPHEIVREWLLDLARGIRRPAPRAPEDKSAPKSK